MIGSVPHGGDDNLPVHAELIHVEHPSDACHPALHVQLHRLSSNDVQLWGSSYYSVKENEWRAIIAVYNTSVRE